jgi:hypothetical protein
MFHAALMQNKMSKQKIKTFKEIAGFNKKPENE